MSANGLILISYGMGAQAFDPPAGERALVSRCRALPGVDVGSSPYEWSDINTIAAAALNAPKSTKIIIGGDSLGANEAPAIATILLAKRTIAYLFGFQRSQYGVQVDIPSNVLIADSIYNPVWIETAGLGDDPWRVASGNTVTRLTNTPIEAAHPDDFGAAQDIIFTRIRAILGV